MTGDGRVEAVPGLEFEQRRTRLGEAGRRHREILRDQCRTGGAGPPTAVTKALRAFQYSAIVRASRVSSLVTEATGATSSSPAITSVAARSYASWAASSGARNSTRSAVVSLGSPAQSAGTP